MQSDRTRWTLALLVLASCVVRAGVAAQDLSTYARDDDAYGRLAINWAESGTYGYPVNDASGTFAGMRPTAYRPPAYPALLRLLVWDGQLIPASVAALHVGLGLGTILLVYRIALRLGIRWPALPALAVACDPILLRGSQLLMTETLITLLTVATWAVWLRLVRPAVAEPGTRYGRLLCSTWCALAMGLLLGVSVLTRPTMLPWAFLIVGLIAYRRLPCGDRPAILSATLLAMAAVIVPWTARNAVEFGKPIWATTHGGYTLLLANNPPLYTHFEAEGPNRGWNADAFHARWASRHDGDPRELEFWRASPTTEIGRATSSAANHKPYRAPDIDELSDDQLANQAAVATIRRQPQMFALSCLYRMGWLWSVYPYEASPAQQWAIGLWYSCWFAMAVFGALKLGGDWISRVWLLPAFLLLSLTAIHAIYWSNMRMRAPMMPVVYVLACLPYFINGRPSTRLKT